MMDDRYELDTTDWPLILSEEGEDGRTLALFPLPDGSSGDDPAGMWVVEHARQIVARQNVLTQIVREMDGTEWNADTLDAIAARLRAAGYEIREVD